MGKIVIRLSPDELRKVAEFLDALTAATQATGVQARGYNRSELTIVDTVLTYTWDDTAGAYVVEQDDA